MIISALRSYINLIYTQYHIIRMYVDVNSYIHTQIESHSIPFSALLLTNYLTLYKGLVEAVQMFGLRLTVRIEDEDDAVCVSLHGGPAGLVLVTATAVPQLHLSLRKNELQKQILSVVAMASFN